MEATSLTGALAWSTARHGYAVNDQWAMTRNRSRRWPWYGQVLDAALALAGLATVAMMVWRNSYPINGILLVAFCTGSLGASQLIDLLAGRWARKDDS